MTTISRLFTIITIIIIIAVKSIPAALGRITSSIAVPVVVVVAAVRVVDRVADRLRRLAVPAVVQTPLAVTGAVADAVLEQVVAVDALRDRRTVAIERHVVAALECVVVADVGVTLLLHTRSTPTVHSFIVSSSRKHFKLCPVLRTT